MQVIKYSRIKLAFGAVCAVGFGVGGMWLWTNFSGKGAFAGLLTAGVMVFVFAGALRYLVDNRIAKIGQQSLEFYGLLGTKRVRYDHIEDVVIETTSSGFFTQRHLALNVADSFGKVRISEATLDKNSGSIESVLEMIAQAPTQSVNRAVPARRRETAAAQPASAAAPPARTFGRKTL